MAFVHASAPSPGEGDSMGSRLRGRGWTLPATPALIALAVFIALSCPALGKGGGSHGSYSTGTHGHHSAAGVERDSHGHIKRSEKPKDEFKKSHPCPSTGKSSGACPGYVIDHVVP